MDVFGVLKGNEVRVSAGVADMEYMVQYVETSEKVCESSYQYFF